MKFMFSLKVAGYTSESFRLLES